MEDRANKKNISRFGFEVIFLIVTAGYFVYCATDRQGFHFFDNVDLVIHEAGHVFFYPFGEFLDIAGGSIFQLLVPLVFVFYFWFKKDFYSTGIVSFWLGQSFVNVARYAGDAIKMDLPLLGNGTHDWNYLLVQTGTLVQAQTISDAFYGAGIAIILAGIIMGILSFSSEKIQTNGSN
jgi:hypothetical protein